MLKSFSIFARQSRSDRTEARNSRIHKTKTCFTLLDSTESYFEIKTWQSFKKLEEDVLNLGVILILADGVWLRLRLLMKISQALAVDNVGAVPEFLVFDVVELAKSDGKVGPIVAAFGPAATLRLSLVGFPRQQDMLENESKPQSPGSEPCLVTRTRSYLALSALAPNAKSRASVRETPLILLRGL